MSRIKVQGASGLEIVLDQLRQPLFDTIELNSASTLNETKEFFSNVAGKKDYQTNLKQPNMLERAVSFRAQGLSIDAQTTSIVVGEENAIFLAKFQERTAVKLRIGDKPWWEGPMRFVTGRVTSFHVKDASAAPATYHLSQYGAQAVQGVMFTGNDYVDIPDLQSFKVQMITADLAGVTVHANNPIQLVCSLKGIMRRPA